MKRKSFFILVTVIIGVFILLIFNNPVIYGELIKNKMKNQIIKALNLHDYEMICELFSDQAMRDSGGVEEGLAYLDVTCIGKCEIDVDGGGHNAVSVSKGEKTVIVENYYWITIDSEEYMLYFMYKRSSIKSDEGLYSLGVVKSELRKESNYNSGRAGIYHPGWD